MEEKLHKILSELHNTNNRMSTMENGQRQILQRMDQLETGQAELARGQKDLTGHIEKLGSGQADIINMLKHTATLMTENFTYIRKDMRTFKADVNADIELLFNEVASVKRKVNKLEQSKK